MFLSTKAVTNAHDHSKRSGQATLGCPGLPGECSQGLWRYSVNVNLEEGRSCSINFLSYRMSFTPWFLCREQAEEMKAGSVVVTFTKGLDSNCFEIVDKTRFDMSWGKPPIGCTIIFLEATHARNDRSFCPSFFVIEAMPTSLIDVTCVQLLPTKILLYR